MIPRLAPPLTIRELSLSLERGRPLAAFEEAFARLAQTKHAIAFPYGRTALICLLEALGIQNQKVICPSYTCVVVPHAISYAGNLPVFIDCASGSYLMDLELAEKAVDDDVGAIVPTSFFGEPVCLDQIGKFSRRHPRVAVIQDCAHGFFCEDNGRPVHKYGIAAIYGLNISKVITSVFGGMVTTDDDLLASSLRMIRVARLTNASLVQSISRRLYFVFSRLALTPLFYGTVKSLSSFGILNRFIRYYREAIIDMPSDYLIQMTSFQSLVGEWQSTRYHEVIAHRRMLANYYGTQLADSDHLRLPVFTPGHTWSHYTVGVAEASGYLEAAFRQGIELGTLLEYFIPEMQAYAGHPHYDQGVAKQYVGRVLNLPIHCQVDLRVADRVIDLLRVDWAGSQSNRFS
jgi:perosamine synthetase